MIVKSPRAKRDLIAAYAYLLEQNPDSTERFLQAAEAAFKKLEKMPEMGHSWLTPHETLKDIRVWPLVPTFRKYLVFYRPIKGGVEILHVFHSARDITAILEEEL